MKKTHLVAAFFFTLSACASERGVPVEEAVQIERSQGGSSVETIVSLYKSGDYIGAFNAIPEQSLAQRMRSSQAFGGMPSPQGEKAVVEELLCSDYDRCDAVIGS